MFNTFPLAARTSVSLKTDYNSYKINYHPGEKTQIKQRDYLPPQVTEFSASFYVDSVSAIESFLYSNGGYRPFYFHDGRLYVCKSYSISYTDDNKGNFTMDLTLYTNLPEP